MEEKEAAAQETELMAPIEVEPVQDDAPAAEPQRRKPAGKAVLAVAAAAVCAVGVAAGIGIGTVITATHPSEVSVQVEQPAQQQGSDGAASQASAVSWSPRYVLVHHAAQTHTVDHAQETGTVTEQHTLCNVCHAEIDGKVAEHQASTGHSGATTNVPVSKEVVTKAAWTETVVDKEAYDELVQDGERSSDGQVRNNAYDDSGNLIGA